MLVARMKEEEGGLCLLTSPWPEASRFTEDLIREHFARNAARPERARFVFNSNDATERAKLEAAILRILDDPLGAHPALRPPEFSPEILARLKAIVSTLVQPLAIEVPLREVRTEPQDDLPYAALAPEPISRPTPVIQPCAQPTAIGVEFTLEFFPLLLLLHFNSPIVEVDRKPHPMAWGTQYLHLTPGVHDVRIYFRALFLEAGVAETQLRVDASCPPRIQYYFRWPWIFARGEIQVC